MATAELHADPLRAIDDALAALDEDQRRLDRQRAILDKSRREILATIGDQTPTLRVGEAHLAAVDQYLREKGQARQANIVEDLGLNSGTVSVSLRKLELDKRVERGEKERGSRVWVHKTRHATVSLPGTGARAA